ncbi:hypothetical protein [Butyrivibrio sp. YAB3001]|uniref:hypothetical protein n=1 Tax=Butyrivibrio sp. YAB3001 TaxID=1520812 RepID=UPI0008F66184|nr:hypothetical protein [Butyrivibrio sp. YAB3001]SFC83782.1 hypothetical protein SAMN02910398_03267 [Butyrivibrio sp. YAB3001]
MDKVEYRIRADEIKALIGDGRYAEAVKIADTIDWKKVRSVSMLCKISDLYKINRRYEESRDVLVMAYAKHPTGRSIVYSLCELSLKLGEFVQAVEYYKEYSKIAPRDSSRFILQYKIYEAQDVSLEERIAVLEEFKRHDYRERWAYELAYLYHRVGLTTECIEECDEIFLWFGEGRYVMKALELKALHEPLTPEQQDRYSRYRNRNGGMMDAPQEPEQEEIKVVEPDQVIYSDKQPTKEMPPVTDEVIRAYNAGEYNGYEEQQHQDVVSYQNYVEPQYETDATGQYVPESEQNPEQVQYEEQIDYPHINEIKEPSVDVSAYNTMNLQETLAQGLKDIIAEETVPDDKAEVFFDTQTVEIPSAPQMGIDIKYGGNGPILGEAKYSEDNSEQRQVFTGDAAVGTYPGAESSYFEVRTYEEKPLEEEVPGAVIHPNASYQMPSHFEKILSQESDGQISMAVEPEPEVEQQVTGQISIDEYMANWEKFKQDQKEKQLQAVKRRVADETGNMFSDYDVNTKAGLQEKLEKAIDDALKKEQYDKASGRGNWEVKREDIISEAVDNVMGSEDVDNTLSEDTVQDAEAQDETVQAEETIQEAIAEELVEETKPVNEEVVEETTEPQSDDKADETSNEPAMDTTEQVVENPENNSAEKTDEETVSETDAAKSHSKNKKKKKHKHEENKPQADNNADTSIKKHIGTREIEERVRAMTPEEKELFGPYIHHKKSRRQIINAIDNLSMDAFTGNAIVTGEEGAGTVNLAKGLIKAVQASDSNFSGKVAKITANTLNKKSTSGIFDKLANGALIIQRAADLEPDTVTELIGILQEENKGLILVMEDAKEDMDKFLERNPSLKQSFNVRVDIEALDDDSLVAYAKQYAYEKEYAIDNLGILALHTRISERQTLDHEVTVAEVKDIIDDAIYYAEKRTVSHFVDVIVHKRYDENDMVILREKDFMH